MGLKELFPGEGLRRRKAAFEAYEEWEHKRPFEPPPEDLFARLDALRALLPVELLVPRADNDYAGIGRMHEALAVLSGSE